jgi:hypothetical protein
MGKLGRIRFLVSGLLVSALAVPAAGQEPAPATDPKAAPASPEPASTAPTASEAPATPAASAATDGSAITAPDGKPAPSLAVTQDMVDEAQLNALMADVSAASADEEDEPSPVQVYGFADVGYRRLFGSQSNPWLTLLNRHPSIFVGNLNTYFDAKLGSKWRSLMEIRFSYLPQGAPDTNISAQTITRENDRTADYTDFTRSKSLGSIMIERAYIEYAAFSFLTLKAGQWLTPYGIWNVDHGSPVIIGVSRPFIIGGELMPEHQVGFMADGSTPLAGDFELSYMAAVSNGRIDKVAYEDLDSNKAVTARTALTWRGLGQMTLGSTFYTGLYTDSVNQLSFHNGNPVGSEKINVQYDERTYAFDYRWIWKGLHVQGEWIINDRKYTAKGRPAGPNGGLSPDRRNSGGYGLIGYRTPWWTIMPYFKAEYTPDPQTQSIGINQKFAIFTGGINVRPRANVVLKTEYVYAYFPDGVPHSFSANSINGLDFQIAWSF